MDTNEQILTLSVVAGEEDVMGGGGSAAAAKKWKERGKVALTITSVCAMHLSPRQKRLLRCVDLCAFA